MTSTIDPPRTEPSPEPDPGDDKIVLPKEPVARRLGRAASHGPLNLFLLVIALLWLLPAFGLLAASLAARGRQRDSRAGGRSSTACRR